LLIYRSGLANGFRTAQAAQSHITPIARILPAKEAIHATVIPHPLNIGSFIPCRFAAAMASG
jgi:hypothetical protein